MRGHQCTQGIQAFGTDEFIGKNEDREVQKMALEDSPRLNKEDEEECKTMANSISKYSKSNICGNDK